MNYYGIHKGARDGSWRCYIDCGITELPIKPSKIANHYGIRCIYDNGVLNPDESGRLSKPNNEFVIIVDKNQSIGRQRFTIMHELGHYLLGHLGDAPLSRSYSSIRPEEEIAADKFAADMLMPACVLWGLNIHTAEDIAELCSVSMQAAQIRAERMEVLYQRGKFLTHQNGRCISSSNDLLKTTNGHTKINASTFQDVDAFVHFS